MVEDGTGKGVNDMDQVDRDTDYLNALVAEAMGRIGAGWHGPDGEARQALWRCGDGWVVGYTTQRITGGPHHGRFAAMAYKPVGHGARSGKADEHQRVYFRGFSTRKAAKARAERLYDQHAK